MNLPTVLIIALSLSMDACAVALSAGLTVRCDRRRAALKTGFFFGLFQMLMPIIGYYLGMSVHQWIAPIDHWIVFALLGLIGLNMIRESLFPGKKKEEEQGKDLCETKTLLLLAFATSIDALAVGISFAMLEINIWISAPIIGVVTFILAALALLLGAKLGEKKGGVVEKYATLAGGIVLIIIGIKTLIEHLGGLA